MADKRPAKPLTPVPKSSPLINKNAPSVDKRRLFTKVVTVDDEEKTSLNWKTFIIPGILILMLIGFFVKDKVFAKKGRFPEPNNTVEGFILETRNLPVFKNKTVSLTNPLPDLTQFVTSDDKKWFDTNYKKLAYVALGQDLKSYNYLNNDEKRIIAMILLARDCPKSVIKQHLEMKKLYTTAEFSFRTNDNLTYEVKLVKEGADWKILSWFGARARWANYIATLNLPDQE